MARMEATSLWILLILGIAGLYLFSQVMVKDTEGAWAIRDTLDLSAATVGVIKIIILVSLSLVIFYFAVKGAKGNFTKQDFIYVAVMALVLWFLWDKILYKVLNAHSMDDITLSVAQKLGLGR
jgi:uncharacterized protein (UPF0333 family)